MCNHTNTMRLASVTDSGTDTGGPVVLYDSFNESVVVISALNNFMTAQSTINMPLPSTQTPHELVFGPGGELLELPQGYTHETIVYAGNSGITRQCSAGAPAMRNYTASKPKIPDMTLTKLAHGRTT